MFILLVLIVAPFAFKGKMMEAAKTQINNTINARVEFRDLKLSFFRDFPNLSVSLHDLSVLGNEPFAGDTLIAFKSFGVSVDVLSAIQMENIRVKKISLIKPVMNAKVLEDGTANWDIMLDTTEIEEAEDSDTTQATEFDASVSLKVFEIIGARLIYSDQSTGMSASVEGFDFTLTGDFSQDFTVLDIDSKTQSIDFVMDGIRYVKKASLGLDINIDANLQDHIFILKENEIAFNELSLGFDGNFAMPNERDITMDMRFATNETSFKSILSMVPAVYLTGFEDVQTDGTFEFNGTVNGIMNDRETPSAEINLAVDNAMFKYPDLPKSVNNINIDVAVNYDGRQNDNTTVDVNKFHLEIADNPVDIEMHIATPMSDMQVNGLFKSELQLASLADALPMEDTKLDGSIITNIDFMGRMSHIENEEYEKFKADGQVTMKDLTYLSSDFPQGVTITSARLNFSPRSVEVPEFNTLIGNSDVQLYGRVENFIPYIFEGDIIRGELKLTSQLLDLNELMSEEEVSETVEEADTTAMEVIEIPENIDFRFESNIAEARFQQMNIKNLYGLIWVREGRAVMENLNMAMLGGELQVTGEYNSRDIENPMVDFGLKASEIDIPQTYETFIFIRELAPIAANASGSVSTSMNFTSFLNHQMSPVLSSIVAEGFLSTQNIRINNSILFTKVGDALKTDKFDEMSLKNFMADFEIRNGRVYIDPFETKIGNTTLLIGGDQGIDQTLNYTMNVTMPRSVLGQGADQLISGLASDLSGSGININPGSNLTFNVDIGGTISNPVIKPRIASAEGGTAKEAIKEQVKENVKAEVDRKKDEAKAKAGAEAEKILKDAEKRADQVRQAARKTADEVRKEANNRADQLLKEARNPIAKKAAEPAAKKIREEGNKKADQIVKEAETKADAIMREARNKADRLKK
jgi:hypothetical protein